MASDRGSRRAHIVGAGIAGLAAAVDFVQRGWAVTLYEAAAQAGGRCRSYHDARLDRWIDNGNHMLLAANTAALTYLDQIGAGDRVTRPQHTAFPFLDLKTGEAWQVEPSRGPLPWWIFDARRRIPGTAPGDYLAALRLARASQDATVADCLRTHGPLWERFWVPLTVAALNTHPREASARLLWLVVRESFAKGAAACRPYVARHSLSDTFVDPALAMLAARGGEAHFGQRLRALELADAGVTALTFGERRIAIGTADAVVLALPPGNTAELVPGLTVPEDSRPIVNAHIRLPEGPVPSRRLSPELPILGLVGGAADWLFLRDDVASLTVSAAETLADDPAEEIAKRMWRDTARALGLDPAAEPTTRIIKERRATLAQTPEALRRRPPQRTRWPNLALAGDWTDTGYPATIESAVRSGFAAVKTLAKS